MVELLLVWIFESSDFSKNIEGKTVLELESLSKVNQVLINILESFKKVFHKVWPLL